MLSSGKVLLAGGYYFEEAPFADAELYDPATENFTRIGAMTKPRVDHTATLLRDGTVLVAGGNEPLCVFSNGVVRCEAAEGAVKLYDPATGNFAPNGTMTSPRRNHTATLLMDGRILIAGGSPDARFSRPGDTAELYVPAVLIPAPIVANLRFTPSFVVAGSSYSVDVSGSNLTPQTFFDVRFTGLDSNEPAVVLNWQKGFAATHDAPAAVAPGIWTIIGVRAHEMETDHTGPFFPVSATIKVFPPDSR